MSCKGVTEAWRTLSELPFTIRVALGDTLGFFHMLVRDGGEEAVEEARGEVAGRLRPLRRHELHPEALKTVSYSDSFT